MDPMRKLWCRAYQTVFRAALPLLPYRSPKILSGIQELPGVLEARGIRHVLLVTDPGIRRCGLTAGLEALLPERGISCSVYDGTCPNPTTDNVEQARALYLREGCQALIAVGGGSSIDCAKAVGARLARPRKSLAQMAGILRVRRPLPLLIAVPTTAGTGSETTLAAVITDARTRHKYPINDFPLIPRYAVLDPELTRSLPPAMTASTGMDTLTHAVEAYIGRSTTKGTRADAVQAVRLVFSNLETAYRDGGNMEARRNMLQAAYLGGRAFTRSYVGYVHAVAHSLGGAYDIPHGLANAVLLPGVLEAYGPAVHRKLHALAAAVGLCGPDTPCAEGAARFIAAIRGMDQRMGIPQTLPGLRREDIPKLARYADREANPLYPVPVLWDAGELERFYHMVMEGGLTHGSDGDRAAGRPAEGLFSERRDPAAQGAR